jgi:hypothetical protein
MHVTGDSAPSRSEIAANFMLGACMFAQNFTTATTRLLRPLRSPLAIVASRRHPGPPMQPSRARLICRSHNPFTPSIALWQHFVLPGRPLTHHQRPAYSTATKNEPAISSDSKFGHVQTPTLIPNELNEDDPIHESPSLPPVPSIRAVYNSIAEGPSRRLVTSCSVLRNVALGLDFAYKDNNACFRPTPLDGSPVRQAGQRSPNAWRHGRPWVDYNRDAAAEANPNSPEALLVQTQNTVDKTGDYEGVVMKSKPVKDKSYLKENNLPWAFQSSGTNTQEESGKLNVPVMERYIHFDCISKPQY